MKNITLAELNIKTQLKRLDELELLEIIEQSRQDIDENNILSHGEVKKCLHFAKKDFDNQLSNAISASFMKLIETVKRFLFRSAKLPSKTSLTARFEKTKKGN